jgi:hypothetical protein
MLEVFEISVYLSIYNRIVVVKKRNIHTIIPSSLFVITCTLFHTVRSIPC